MASRAFTHLVDHIGYYATLPVQGSSWRVMLLKSTNLQPDDDLVKHRSFAAILASTNREADFANYGRKTVTAITRTVVDDAPASVRLAIPEQTWVQAGSSTGGVNNRVTKAVVGYAPTANAADSTILPLLALEIYADTDGNDLTLRNPNGIAIVSSVQAA